MRVEPLDTPSLLELRAIIAQRLHAYGAFEGCTAEDQRVILAQACLAIWHLTAGEEGRDGYTARTSVLGYPSRRCSTPSRGCARMSLTPCRGTSPCGMTAFGRRGGIRRNGMGAVTV
jgi:hypothetical protein